MDEEQAAVNADGGNIVTYTDRGYSPANFKVKVGTTITFKNESSQTMWIASAVHPSHRAYDGTSLSEHCTDATQTSFDECQSAQPGEEWEFKFMKSGTWEYHNHDNPSDTGTIVVRE